MLLSGVEALNKKLCEYFDIENEIVKNIQDGHLEIENVPENLFTTRIVIAFILKDAKNYELLPYNLKCREFALLATQLDRKVYESMSDRKVLPIELHSWVAQNSTSPALSFINPQHRSEHLSSALIKVNPKNIAYLPEQLYKNFEYLKSLIILKAESLKYIPEEYITETLCDIAYEVDDYDLSYVPTKFRSEELCSKSFVRNYKSIFSIPKEFLTATMVKVAIQNAVQGELQSIVELTPVEFQDEDYWREVVIKDSGLLRIVPEKFVDEHFIFDIAKNIKKASNLLCVKPEILQNTTVKFELIRHNPLLLEAIPQIAKDYMLCFEAVTNNGMALQFVPAVLQNLKMYNAALENNGLSIKHIPAPYRDDSIPMKAVSQNGEAIEYIQPHYITYEMCKVAISNNPRAIYFLPSMYKSEYDLYLLAIKKDPRDLRIVAEQFRTAEICRIALRENPKNFVHIPVNVRTDEEIVSLYMAYKKEGALE